MKIRTRKLTLEEQKELVYRSYNYASIIDDIYESVINSVVNNNYCGILAFRNHSEELQFQATKRYCSAITFINNPTKDVQISCVERNPILIFYIDNPCQEAINVTALYNLNLDDDSIIKCIKRDSKNAQYFRFISESVEDFIITECQEAGRWLTRPSKRMQLFAVNERVTDYLEKHQLCKEALDLFKNKYFLNKELCSYDWKIRYVVKEFLSQHNLDLSVKELYFILKKYNTGLKPYLSYEIVDKLLEIDSSDIDDYNIKDSSLLEKYSSSRKCLAVI